MASETEEPPGKKAGDALDAKYVTIRVPKWLLWGSCVLVAGISVFLGCQEGLALLSDGGGFYVEHELMEDMGMENVILFRQHDRNNDGVLTIEEFEPLAYRLQQTNETHSYDYEIEAGDDVVTIEAFFTPLEQDTMTKPPEERTLSFAPSLKGLKSWQKVNKEWQNFGASMFKPFLPPQDSIEQELGTFVYDLVEFVGKGTMNKHDTLSTNRYLPLKLLKDADIQVHRLLAMFHPNPFVHSRFNPQGAVACVRAYSDEYVDIQFRIHAEFQLNEPPFYPYWFTPGQLAGNMVIKRDASKLIHFQAYVPTDNKLNVDMEWMNGPKVQENAEVDIGFMPRMELLSVAPSIPAFNGTGDQRERRMQDQNRTQTLTALSNIKWKAEMSEAKAKRLLEVQLYPFKKVEYFKFPDAYARARVEKKLVHQILLWGVLDDQSC